MRSAHDRLPKTIFQRQSEMSQNLHPFQRRPVRFLLKKLSIPAFAALTRLEIIGEENLPNSGPLLVVGNHFSFIDPVAFVRMAPWPIEFVGGAETPHAPLWTRIIPFLWGYHKLYRGTGSRAGSARRGGNPEEGRMPGNFPGRRELGDCFATSPPRGSIPGDTEWSQNPAGRTVWIYGGLLFPRDASSGQGRPSI